MNINRKQTTSLLGALAGSLMLLVGVLALAGQSGPAVHAASLSQGESLTPLVTITQPALNALLTRTPQLVEITYNCGLGTSCLGANQVRAVSLTVNGDTGPYHPASLAFSDTLGGLYTCTWSLNDQDYVSHALRARALNAWGNVGTSPLLTVCVDTLPPHGAAITAPAHIATPTFTVSWSASDGSGAIYYDLQYRRNDQASWTGWLTHSDTTSRTFVAPAQVMEGGRHYTFRMQASDRGRNLSSWVTTTVRAGRYHLYLPLVVHRHPLPWQQGTGSQDVRFRTPSGCGSATWYAGTPGADGVWKSTDNAQTWSQVAGLQPDAYPVVANPANCDEAFVAVWGAGVYRLTGDTSTAINGDLGEPYLYGLTLSGATLYAGTSSQGVYKTSLDDIHWQPANDGMDDLRIRSLHALGTNLYAGSRGCALHISPDGGSTWGVQKVLTTNCDDAQVWSVARVQQTLYAGLGLEKGLYYLDVGLWKRVVSVPARSIYGLAYDENGHLYVSAYEAGIYRCPVDANGRLTSCEPHNLGLTTLDTREIRIHGDLVVVSSDDGVWYRPSLP